VAGDQDRADRRGAGGTHGRRLCALRPRQQLLVDQDHHRRAVAGGPAPSLHGAIAALVAGSALLVVLVYRYRDVGQLGPIPSMYEPIWDTKKTVSAFAEGAALLAAVRLILVFPGGQRRP
jgi:hypothetical protein